MKEHGEIQGYLKASLYVLLSVRLVSIWVDADNN